MRSVIFIISTDSTIEDPSEFALEKHLEDFLVKNWKGTELGKRFDIYEEDGEHIWTVTDGKTFKSGTWKSGEAVPKAINLWAEAS